MLDAGEFVAALRRRGFGLFTGVPCSYLTPLINRLIDASDVRYVGAANEGDAVAIATLVLGFNFLGDGLRDRIDPKSRL